MVSKRWQVQDGVLREVGAYLEKRPDLQLGLRGGRMI